MVLPSLVLKMILPLVHFLQLLQPLSCIPWIPLMLQRLEFLIFLMIFMVLRSWSMLLICASNLLQGIWSFFTVVTFTSCHRAPWK